jgi:hypothetical protein
MDGSQGIWNICAPVSVKDAFFKLADPELRGVGTEVPPR